VNNINFFLFFHTKFINISCYILEKIEYPYTKLVNYILNQETLTFGNSHPPLITEFNFYLGSLLPNQKVTIELSYVIEAQWEGESLRITFPTTIAPRYTPEQLQHDENHQLNPIYHSNDNKLPYKFSFEANVKLTHDTISSFESPTHKLDRVEISPDRATVSTKTIAKEGDIVSDRDIVLIVHSANRSQRKAPVMIDEIDENGSHVLYLSFIPKLICNKIPEKQIPEIVFLIDRSRFSNFYLI